MSLAEMVLRSPDRPFSLSLSLSIYGVVSSHGHAGNIGGQTS